MSAGTVKSHLESIFRRLNVRNRTQAAIVLLEERR
ncbi:LuxR C-terminal-related transcriptional regulator [Pectobacterium brasiliense]|nr:LuxR C-terminal-related transcriptional regulator [Pectobacterium brasiliense]